MQDQPDTCKVEEMEITSKNEDVKVLQVFFSHQNYSMLQMGKLFEESAVSRQEEKEMHQTDVEDCNTSESSFELMISLICKILE